MDINLNPEIGYSIWVNKLIDSIIHYNGASTEKIDQFIQLSYIICKFNIYN